MTGSTKELQGFRKLYEFSQLLLRDDDPERLLERLVEAIRAITDADEVIFFGVEGHEPVVQTVASDPGPEGTQQTPKYSESLVAEVIERGAPLLLKDVGDDPRFEESKSIQLLSITSAMGAPLFHNGELIGIIYASRQRLSENFTEEHRELMTVAASQASLLVSRLASAQALGETESRHRSLVEMSPSTIAVIHQGTVAFANQTACELWGRDRVDEVVGLEIETLFDPWRSQALLEALVDGQAFDSIDAWVRRLDSDSGVPVEVVGRPIAFDGSGAMQIMISEVGEKKNLLARRVRTDRLVVMGTMAATVGHEINNPLSYVYANLDFVVEELERWWKSPPVELPDDEVRQDVMDGLYSAQEGTERIRAVVESIQNFTRLEDDHDEPTDIEESLESSLRIARSKLGPDVDLQVDIRPIPPVSISAARAGQVFLNLLINAAQALAEVEDCQEPKRVEVRARQEDQEVVVEIADNGPGIDPEIRPHIFEPFVSTKSGDSGTGLGLAICNDIVGAAGGDIEVDEQSSGGCLFRIRLPCASEPVTRSFEVVPENHRQGSGYILVVDPDATLGTSLKRVLQSQHEVDVVNTCGRAVELLSSQRRFDVILCDLRFRGGMGRDLFRWVEEQAPQYWDRLVAMTTGRTSQEAHRYLEDLPNPWLAKPFDINRLRAVINGLLEASEEEVGIG